MLIILVFWRLHPLTSREVLQNKNDSQSLILHGTVQFNKVQKYNTATSNLILWCLSEFYK